MSRLADVPLRERMDAVAKLCRQTDSPEERAELFQVGIDGRASDPAEWLEIDWDHLMRCIDPHCLRCAA